MNFQLQIEQIVGRPAIGNSTSEVDAYRLQVNSYLKQSARTIVDLLPVETLIKDCISLPIADDNGLDITDKRLVKVLRNDFGCMEMPLEL